ncbi:MmcQ/YjbR family DNA-binding protein [Georgenia wangjunii]|uniref:MmcQ/YjbR family DNA-binding protein n=1 Tax=Georgenia wangjunii TaxID=3117730 RepID=UPI002F26D5B7
MAHPQMFDDGDPYLRRLRPIALAFPDAEELISHGRPCFRARKLFAVYGSSTKGSATTRTDYPHGLLVLPAEEERRAVEADPRTFLPAYLGAYGWVGLDLAAGGAGPDGVDWAEVAELLDDSYRQVAAAAMVARLDADGGPAGRGTPR